MAALGMPQLLHSKSSEKNKSERTIFITGGARGIGFQTAIEFANNGDNIVLYDIANQINSVPYKLSSKQNLDNAQKHIESLGVKCLAIQGDVRKPEALKSAVESCVAKFGSIDVLIANAAVTAWADVGDISEKIINDMLAINVAGVIHSVQAVTPYFKEQNYGRVICMSSIAGRAGAFKFSLYAATKWAVIGFAKTVAMELGQYNVTCNCICPTSINTNMLNNTHMGTVFGKPDDPRQASEDYFRSIHALPAGVLEPNEISQTIKFLCSAEATKITGSVIDVDAGVVAGNNA